VNNRSKLTLFILLSIISCEVNCGKGKPKRIFVKGDSNGPSSTKIHYALRNAHNTWELQTVGPTSQAPLGRGVKFLGTNLSPQHIKLYLDQLNKVGKNQPKELSPAEIAKREAEKAARAQAKRERENNTLEKMAAAVLNNRK
jgi:hypothetical protein